MDRLEKLVWSEEGQGLTEYIIVTALIGLAAISALNLFGSEIETFFARMVGMLGNGRGSAGTAPGHVAPNVNLTDPWDNQSAGTAPGGAAPAGS